MTQVTPGFHLRLLDRFELRRGERVIPVTTGPQRLITFLALHNRLLQRGHVAGVLWPEVPTDRANANLRASIWRLPAASRAIIELSLRYIKLGPDVSVDITMAVALAQRLLDRSRDCPDSDLSGEARSVLSADLLPTCYDDWALVECERFHQLRLHALEALCERLTAAERYGEAVDAGLAAVSGEPLRESAHRALIKAHIAEGNFVEARQQYDLCRRIVRDELGIEPSASLRRLMLASLPARTSMSMAASG
ncbi:MAG TPA: BTAD domain-containing putative transcriptional regulator [Streptosporangiaceae bacterium]|nr:BTAD domain-containing putative transcriptional regulator [Streptosporangiaceae bacterium]